ncbi:unnamed protein product [Phytophthora fragariaefolia]|uniref:Unnamed protein product n=1 Tax=Phytophthora fragariaefolia TaxID=1490495 RepID=A0A9W6XSL1_9STRA|nr:unnamed protein product [Phytophthora fragariaefolia]
MKKNGKYIRLCIDYRVVNQLIKLLNYPLPLIDKFMSNFAATMWFMMLDMASRFWAVPMTARAKLISAFIYPLGHFQWRQMPCGLKNAPLIYQQLLDICVLAFVRLSPAEESQVDPDRANGATSTDSESHAKKSPPTKEQVPATATAPSAKPTRRTRASKRKEVRLSRPYVEPAPSESDTDTPNTEMITGDEDSTADSTAPRATKPSGIRLASANTTASEPAPVEEAPIPSPDASSNPRKAEDFLNSSDTQDTKSSTSATPPAKAPQERSPPPEDGPDPVDYEESEPDQDREQGEVSDPNSSPQITEQQRVTHPGSPMAPKTAAVVARVEAQAQSASHRDTAPTDMPEQ